MDTNPATPTPTPEALDKATHDLISAHWLYTLATREVLVARYELEKKRVQLISQGLEGESAWERTTRLKQALQAEMTDLAEAELVQLTKRAELDRARLHWNCLRVWLMFLEVTTSSPTREQARE